MADETSQKTEPPSERIEPLVIEDEMKNSYLTYAMSVIMSRALPDVRDGLKPSQRRILVAMNDLNLGPRGKHRKCAKIAGDTSGNYHPHGEAVVYPTLVGMAQHWRMRVPLVHPQGNFGSIDGDPPAAMRYTEARLTAPAMEMLEDLKLDTVDFQENYDGTRQEPAVLPSKLPNLLVNGGVGIAVGMATSLPPHNLREVCDAIIKVMDNPDVALREIMEVLPGPDFPTGATICGRRGIAAAYATGRGTITLRGRHEVEENKGRTQIVIKEIPYQLVKANLVTRIAECVNSNLITGISDVRDLSSREGMRIVVELKREGDPNLVINQLYKYTPLQSNFSVINIALVNRRPVTLPLKRMIELYIDHRKNVIRRRTRFLLSRARQRAHLLEGLILAVCDIDEIIDLIKQSQDVATAKQSLMERPLRLSEQATLVQALPERFSSRALAEDQFLTGPQANAILQMQLQRLTGLEVEKLARDYSGLIEEIEGYEAILRDEKMVLDIIREDLFELKEKYGDDRRTDISGDVSELNIEDLVAEEAMVVTLSHEGYIKRVPADTYRKQGRGGRGIIGSESKKGDFIEHLFAASTHDYLLFFTNRGRCYWQKVYDLPQMSRTSRGRAIANLLQMQPNESINSVLAVNEFDEQRMLVMSTASGTVKKTALSAYSRPRRGGINAITLDTNDNLVSAVLTNGSDELVLASADGMAIRFPEEKVRAMGRTARGVKGIKLRENDKVVGMVVVDPQATLLSVCENGYGKRTDFEEYRTQSRGGIGLINIKTSERNGKVVTIKTVTDDDELMLISSGGILIRTGLSEVRAIGRSTQGVRMIRLESGDKLVAVARIINETEEQEAEAT